MTWGKVSDDLHGHPKWTAAPPNAKALWTTALSYCNSYLLDGKVSQSDLEQLAVKTFGFKPSALRMAQAAADELVRVRLWNLTPDGWVFHDWKDNNPTRAQVNGRKARDRRRDWLHKTPEGKALKRRVRERDGDVCSWCAQPVRWGAGGAPDAAEFDHVDADGPNEAWNVVVSCRSCNGTKRDVDFEELGFHLREDHELYWRWTVGRSTPDNRADGDTFDGARTPADSAGARPASATDRAAHGARAGREPGRDGAGRAGTGSGRGGTGRGGTGAPKAPSHPGPRDDRTRGDR